MHFLLLTIGNGVDHLESNEYYKKLLNMAVLAGSIMISSGAETHRGGYPAPYSRDDTF